MYINATVVEIGSENGMVIPIRREMEHKETGLKTIPGVVLIAIFRIGSNWNVNTTIEAEAIAITEAITITGPVPEV